MVTLRKGVEISLVLGILSLFALAVSHLALTDIRHGEVDVSTEWQVIRVSYAVIVVSQVFALITLRRILREGRKDKDAG